MTIKEVIQIAHNPGRFTSRDLRAALRALRLYEKPKGELLQWCERKIRANLDEN